MIGWIKNFFRRLLTRIRPAAVQPLPPTHLKLSVREFRKRFRDEEYKPEHPLSRREFRDWRNQNTVPNRPLCSADASLIQRGFAPTIPEWYERSFRKPESK